MPVTDEHPQYAASKTAWQTIRDVIRGEQALKAGGTAYLPMLGGQKMEHYQVYKDRNTFYNAVARTVEGLVGLIMRHPPVVTGVFEQFLPWLDDITLAGVPLTSFVGNTVKEQVEVSRLGVLVDMSEDGAVQRPKWSAYCAESITLWRETMIAGANVLTLVVLKEWKGKIGPDGFGSTEEEQYRVLDFDASGFYRQRVFEKRLNSEEWMVTKVLEPARRGQRLDFIPFKFIGARDLTPDVDEPRLLALSLTNLAHYRESADYWHKMHWNAVVQAIVFTNKNDDTYYFGGPVAWILNPGDSAMMLESNGTGIDAHERALDKLESRMARLGAELLDTPIAGVEAAETVRLRQAGRASVLALIADTASRGLTQCLQWYLWWAGVEEKPEDVQATVTVNTDFIDARMTVEELLGFMQAMQSRGISRDTYFYNLKKGGLLPDNRSIEDEKALIESDPPAMPEVKPEPGMEEAA
jgi:hypothetical protein